MAQTYANNDNVLSKVKFGNTTYYIKDAAARAILDTFGNATLKDVALTIADGGEGLVADNFHVAHGVGQHFVGQLHQTQQHFAAKKDDCAYRHTQSEIERKRNSVYPAYFAESLCSEILRYYNPRSARNYRKCKRQKSENLICVSNGTDRRVGVAGQHQ